MENMMARKKKTDGESATVKPLHGVLDRATGPGTDGATDHPAGPVHDTIPDVDDPGEHLGMMPDTYAKWDANDIAHLTDDLNRAQEEVNRKLGVYSLSVDPGVGSDVVRTIVYRDGVPVSELAPGETFTDTVPDTAPVEPSAIVTASDLAAIRRDAYANGYADGVALNQTVIADLKRGRDEAYEEGFAAGMSESATVVARLERELSPPSAVVARILRDAEAGRLKIAEWVTRGPRHILRQMVVGVELGEVFVTTDEMRKGQHVLLYGARCGSVPMPVDADLDSARQWVEARNVEWVVA